MCTHAWTRESGQFKLPCAVFLGTFTVLAVRFHGLEPWAGFLLLPFLGFSVFGAALLNLSLRSGNAEVSASSLLRPQQDRADMLEAGHKMNLYIKSPRTMLRTMLLDLGCDPGRREAMSLWQGGHHRAGLAV